MFDLAEREEAQRQNRARLTALIRQIPEGIPAGWTRKILAVGGLMYVGFSERRTEKLVCISSQGQSLIDCVTGEKRYENECYDEGDLLAYSAELGDETVPIAGEGGGGLRAISRDGDILERISPAWPSEQIVFAPNYASWVRAPQDCRVVGDDLGITTIKAYGFSGCGRFFVIATSADVTIYQKTEDAP